MSKLQLLAVICIFTSTLSQADEAEIAQAICENQVIPNDTYNTECQVSEYYNGSYKFYKDASWVSMVGSALGLTASIWYLHQDLQSWADRHPIVSMGWLGGFVGTVAGIWGSIALLDTHLSSDEADETFYALESETPNLRNGVIDIQYQATKTVDHKNEPLWDNKPGKTGILWTAGLQASFSSINFLLGFTNGYLQGDLTKYQLPVMTLMVGSSACAVIDWYANPG